MCQEDLCLVFILRGSPVLGWPSRATPLNVYVSRRYIRRPRGRHASSERHRLAARDGVVSAASALEEEVAVVLKNRTKNRVYEKKENACKAHNARCVHMQCGD